METVIDNPLKDKTVYYPVGKSFQSREDSTSEMIRIRNLYGMEGIHRWYSSNVYDRDSLFANVNALFVAICHFNKDQSSRFLISHGVYKEIAYSFDNDIPVYSEVGPGDLIKINSIVTVDTNDWGGNYGQCYFTPIFNILYEQKKLNYEATEIAHKQDLDDDYLLIL